MSNDTQLRFPRVKELMEKGFRRTLPVLSSKGTTKLRSLTNQEVADRVGCSQTLISYFRNGVRRAPDEKEAEAIAKAFYPPPRRGAQQDLLTEEWKIFSDQLKAAAEETAVVPSGNTL